MLLMILITHKPYQSHFNDLPNLYLKESNSYNQIMSREILASYQENIWDQYRGDKENDKDKKKNKLFNIIDIDLPTGYGKTYLIYRINADKKYKENFAKEQGVTQKKSTEIIEISISRDQLVQWQAQKDKDDNALVDELKKAIKKKIGDGKGEKTINIMIDEAPMLSAQVQDLLYKDLWIGENAIDIKNINKINIFSVSATPHRQDIKGLAEESENMTKAKIAYNELLDGGELAKKSCVSYKQKFSNFASNIAGNKHLNLSYIDKDANWLEYTGNAQNLINTGNSYYDIIEDYNLTEKGKNKIKEIYEKIQEKLIDDQKEVTFYLGKFKVVVNKNTNLNDLKLGKLDSGEQDLPKNNDTKEPKHTVMLYDKSNYAGGDYVYWSAIPSGKWSNYNMQMFIEGKATENNKPHFMPDEILQILGRNRNIKMFDQKYPDNIKIAFAEKKENIEKVLKERVAKIDKHPDNNKTANRDFEIADQAYTPAKDVLKIFNLLGKDKKEDCKKLIEKLDQIAGRVELGKLDEGQQQGAIHFRDLYGTSSKNNKQDQAYSQFIISALSSVDNTDKQNNKEKKQNNLAQLILKDVKLEGNQTNQPLNNTICDYLKHKIKFAFEKKEGGKTVSKIGQGQKDELDKIKSSCNKVLGEYLNDSNNIKGFPLKNITNDKSKKEYKLITDYEGMMSAEQDKKVIEDIYNNTSSDTEHIEQLAKSFSDIFREKGSGYKDIEESVKITETRPYTYIHHNGQNKGTSYIGKEQNNIKNPKEGNYGFKIIVTYEIEDGVKDNNKGNKEQQIKEAIKKKLTELKGYAENIEKENNKNNNNKNNNNTLSGSINKLIENINEVVFCKAIKKKVSKAKKVDKNTQTEDLDKNKKNIVKLKESIKKQQKRKV